MASLGKVAFYVFVLAIVCLPSSGDAALKDRGDELEPLMILNLLKQLTDENELVEAWQELRSGGDNLMKIVRAEPDPDRDRIGAITILREFPADKLTAAWEELKVVVDNWMFGY